MSNKPKIRANTDGTVPYRADAWANPVSGQSIPGIDKSTAQTFAPTMMSYAAWNNQQVLTNLYMGDWLARKICDRPAEDATRKFIEITGLDDEQKKIVEAMIAQLGLQKAVRKGIIWSRLYGGAGVLKIYDDARPPEVEPSPGATIIDLVPLDRWSLSVSELDNDPASPHYGRALSYTARNGAVYHRSRISAFYGAEVPYDAQLELNGWGGSYIAMAWSAISDYQGTLQDASFLLKESGVGILKIPNLTAQSTMGGGIMGVIQARADKFNQGKSIYRTGVVDTQEDFNFINRSLQGIPDFIDRFATAVSGATGMSELILFGRSPSGLNASQAELLAVWHDQIKALQEGDPTALVSDVMESIRNETGFEFDWEWCNLNELTPEQKGTAMTNAATAIAAIEPVAALTVNETRGLLIDTGLFKLDLVPEDTEEEDPLGLNNLSNQNAANDVPGTTGTTEAE